MPGGFTHFGIVKSLNTHGTLMSIDGMTDDIALDLMEAYQYVELGAVSPDLPYLAPLTGNAGDWGYRYSGVIHCIIVSSRSTLNGERNVQ